MYISYLSMTANLENLRWKYIYILQMDAMRWKQMMISGYIGVVGVGVRDSTVEMDIYM